MSSEASHGGDGVALRHRGTILTAGVVLSFGGLILRQIEIADAWQILFYRSGFLGFCLMLYLLWREQGRLLANLAAVGFAGVLGGLCLAVAMSGFVWSITHTTVANTLFIMAASPFFAAVLGWLLLKERVRARTWSTMLLAGLGIAAMVGDGIVIGHVAGQLAALATTVAIACFTVILRWRRHVDLLSAALYASLISGGFAAVVAGGDLAVPLADAFWCLVYGGPVVLLGLGLYIHGGRFVPAAEVALLSLSEVALGPLWVWLVIDETPSSLSLLGGGIVLTAVVMQILLGGRPRRLPAPLD